MTLPKNAQRLAYAAVLAVVATVHANGLFGVFVFDDVSITENKRLADPLAFDWFSIGPRTVGIASFAFQFAFLGRTAFDCHLVNWAIHLTNVALIMALVQRLTRFRFPNWSSSKHCLTCCAVGCLWGVHPLTTSAVTYVVQRYESLASLWMIAALLTWVFAQTKPADDGRIVLVKRVRWPWCVACGAFSCLAFGTKEISAALPLILLSTNVCVLYPSVRQAIKRSALPALLMIPISFGAYLRSTGLLRAGNRTSTIGFGLVGIDWHDYVLFQPVVYLRYLKLILLPTDQVLDYGWLPPQDGPAMWLGGLGWLLIFVLLAWAFRRLPLLAWSVCCGLLILAVTSVVPLTDSIFEHRVYLPLAFLVGAAVVAISARFDGLSVRSSGQAMIGSAVWRRILSVPVLGALLLILVVYFSAFTNSRNGDYADALRLAKLDLERSPENPRNVYRMIRLAEVPESAKLSLLTKAIEMSEDRGYFFPGTNYKWPRELADSYFLQGEMKAARPWYERALPESHDRLQQQEIEWSLALIAAADGDGSSAEKWFAAALQHDSSISPQIQKTYDAFRHASGPTPHP
ncbi:MAG: hypothetical protein AAGA03_01560 [Planctomycetota bacterium]